MYNNFGSGELDSTIGLQLRYSFNPFATDVYTTTGI